MSYSCGSLRCFSTYGKRREVHSSIFFRSLRVFASTQAIMVAITSGVQRSPFASISSTTLGAAEAALSSIRANGSLLGLSLIAHLARHSIPERIRKWLGSAKEDVRLSADNPKPARSGRERYGLIANNESTQVVTSGAGAL